MKVALGQFAVAPDWKTNLAQCEHFVRRAREENARLLVLPEGILAADSRDMGLGVRTAQPLDGPFVSGLIAALAGSSLTVIGCIPVPARDGFAWNCQIAVTADGVRTVYRKLHLYDAFSMKESDHYLAGDEIPPLLEIDGIRVGLMTCYDVRFPELARRLVLDGADLLTVPAAWVRGPSKEWHWEVMVTARALENTCYVAAVGECGPRNIGASMMVDPLGTAVVRAGAEPDFLVCEVSRERLDAARQKLPVLKNRRFARPEPDTGNPPR